MLFYISMHTRIIYPGCILYIRTTLVYIIYLLLTTGIKVTSFSHTFWKTFLSRWSYIITKTCLKLKPNNTTIDQCCLVSAMVLNTYYWNQRPDQPGCDLRQYQPCTNPTLVRTSRNNTRLILILYQLSNHSTLASSTQIILILKMLKNSKSTLFKNCEANKRTFNFSIAPKTFLL